jgi:murein DD-endopeptidase MepM/ murein hydrolase activator NlpD
MKLFLLFLCLVVYLPGTAGAQYEQSENEVESQTAENTRALEVKPVQMDGKYRWPLDINNGISSSFQEFRSNHFHAGFDLRTMQKTGYPVYAIADGVIYKIRMEKRGSGRGLYLKQDDGNTSIYFHLDRFETKLEDIVNQVRSIKGRKYFGNYFLKKPLRYKRGELIGYSGETGAGFPHLHLEIRDPRQSALNPFKLVELPSRDNNSPVLNGVLLRNMSPDPINGKIGEHYFKFKRGKFNQFASTLPVIVTGSFDLVLNARDISDSGKYVSPYEISVSIDEHNYFDLKFERFQWADNNQLGFVYDMLYSSPSSYYFNLFSQEGFSLEEKHVPLQGVIDSLARGEHRLNIRVRDNSDNVSTGVLIFQKVGKPVLSFGGASVNGNIIQLVIDRLEAEDADAITLNLKDGNGKTLYSGSLKYTTILERKEFTLKGAFNGIRFLDFNFLKKGIVYFTERFLLKDDWLAGITDIDYETFINRDDVYIKINKPVLAPGNLGLIVLQGGESLKVKAEPGGGFFYFRFKPLNNANNVRLHFGIFKDGQKIVEIQKKLYLISLKRGVVQKTDFEEFSARFAGQSVYEPKVMQLEERDYKSDFPVLSRQIDLSPYFFPFLDEVFYTFTKDLPNPQQVGIFKYDPEYNQWSYRHTIYESAAKTYKTKVLSSGTYALMRDIFPPRIFFKKPFVKHKKNLKRLVVKITDKGKGVNDGTLRVQLNGKWVDCEYDPDWRTVVIEDLKHLQVGKNTFNVEIKDYASHKTAKAYTIYLE